MCEIKYRDISQKKKGNETKKQLNNRRGDL